MGISTGGATSGINVAPLVDICLVLLSLFIIILPASIPEISVKAAPMRDGCSIGSDHPLVLGLARDGTLTLNRDPVDRASLPEILANDLGFREKKVVFINFDADARYGVAVEILDVAKRSGADVLAIMKTSGGRTPNSLRSGS